MCGVAVSSNAEDHIPRLLSLDYRLPVCLQNPIQSVDVETLLLQRVLAGPNHLVTSRMIFPVAGKNPAEQTPKLRPCLFFLTISSNATDSHGFSGVSSAA